MTPLWIVLIVVGVIILWAIVSYNRLVTLREQVRAALADAHLGGVRGADLQRLLRDELALYEEGGDT